MSLIVLHLDGRKLLCSALDADELRRLWSEVKRLDVLFDSGEQDSQGLALGLGAVGPLRMNLGPLELIMWGTQREPRFYTPEEFAVLTGEDHD